MDVEGRTALAKGAICGIIALMNSGDGPTNGFSYYLGVNDNVPHGLAGAVFLKEVMSYNISHGYSEYQELLPINSDELLAIFSEIYDYFSIKKLSSFGYNTNNIDKFVDGATESLKGSFDGNPILFNRGSAKEVVSNLI